MKAVARFIGSGAYTGFAPVASGTFGTLPGVALAIPFGALLVRSTALYTVALVAAVAVAIWAADRCAYIFESKDPSQVTVDEVVGFLFTVGFIYPLDVKTLVIAFFLFRLFDVWKPWPASAAEAWPGGIGIVADDLIAGLYANLVLRIVLAYTS